MFNYSANDMYPYEYKKFITYSDKLIDNNIKYIVLGVDFFGTNKLENKKHIKDEFLKPTEKLFYRISSLYSIKLFEYSIKNLRFHLKLKKPYYSRNNIKNEPPTYRPNSLMKIEKTLIKHKYEYDEKLINYWKELKRNSNVKFIIFTTPVTIEQMNYYESQDLMKFYFQWLSELVEVFEEVNHFMYPNDISNNYNNFLMQIIYYLKLVH
ncbi:MAG: hypothetical protein U5K55_01470 [Aliarcobacter sp.]|nr:hypothetical protein [Aliarcobacter sp.]